MKKIRTLLICLFAAVLSFSAISCNTIKEIPEDLTSAQLLRLGQNAYASGDYINSERYYLETIARFGDDTEVYIETRYELGHLYMKTKDYRKAFINFNDILKIYQTAPMGSFPTAYKKLAQNQMDQIPDEYKK
ncbi:MAG: tetratricopeptide repeat protein [Treponema sp.]|nr:tetratricopeptide repeat protein [Treponema sp.]